MADGAPDDWLFNSAPVPAAAPIAPAPIAQTLLPPSPKAAPAASGGNSGMAINNPLNLRPLSAGQWGGQSGVSPAGFAAFADPASGWNAADQNLQAKVTRHGLTTVAGIIGDPTNGWAPAADNNDPASYAAKVAAGLGVKPTDDISGRVSADPAFRHKMLEQMAAVETGSPQTFGGATGGAEPPAGMTDAELHTWLGLQAPPATTPAGQTLDTTKQFTVGQDSKPPTSAQAAFYKEHYPQGGDNIPYALQAGGPIPQTPGAHYVDLDGNEHVVPGGLAKIAENALAGLGQAFGPDVANSANRLTGGGMATAPGPSIMPSGNPMMGAFAGMQPGALAQQQQMADASLAGGAAQQRRYAFEHAGDQSAQAGRFAGQALLGTAAAAAVPEIEGPAALGNFGRMAAQATTNALRGAVATAPSVGANPQNVGQQLEGGAVAGALLPPVLRKAGMLGADLAGLSRTPVEPEVQALADKAINTHGIPLRASQIAGTADPSIAVKDSNLITAPGSGFASNNAAQHQAFTRAVAATFGASSDKVTPPVMAQARRDLGQQFEDFGASHAITNVDDLQSRLGGIVKDAQSVMPESEVAPLLNQVQNIGDVATRDANGNRVIPGDAYLALTKTGAPLDRVMQSKDSNVRYYAGQIHDALSDALAQNATPQEVSDFANTRLQYKNLMTVKGLAAQAGITGEISPVKLASVVNRSFDDRAFSGAGPLGELADIGQTFMKQPPNSFTAQRGAEIAGRNWLPALIGGGALGEATMLHDPEMALKLGTAAALTKGASYGVNALEGLRYGANAGKSLIRPPGTVSNALSGLNTAAKSVEVPLSALAGARLNPGSIAGGMTGSTVGANAQ